MAFERHNGTLFCEALALDDVAERVGSSPFYVYSAATLRANYAAYANAFADRDCVISYAVKANANLRLLEIIRSLGAACTLVSGNELRMAVLAGFDPASMIFNGNGKTVGDIKLAIDSGVMLNVDSAFDLVHVERAATEAGRSVEVVLRVNPDIDAKVHHYVATGVQDSKFGVSMDEAAEMWGRIASSPVVTLAGFHCHLGSTIDDVTVLKDAVVTVMAAVAAARALGHNVRVLNMGGGLGIDYERRGAVPSPADLAAALQVPDDITLVVEPGRSIVASAGALLCEVIGVKDSARKRFIVTDASMAELLRPSLYDAYHLIEPVVVTDSASDVFDVVGPVCESGDFIARNREMVTPQEGDLLAILDAGAYGFVMSSNYNLRTRPAEYLVDGDSLTCIRPGETFDDLAAPFRESDT